jgi:hypothetical protein
LLKPDGTVLGKHLRVAPAASVNKESHNKKAQLAQENSWFYQELSLLKHEIF